MHLQGYVGCRKNGFNELNGCHGAAPARRERDIDACVMHHQIDSNMHSRYVADMKTLTVREVPDEVYGVIKQEAEANQRSIQEQVRYVLAKEARLRHGGFRAAAKKWRTKVAGRPMGDTVVDIREGRNRR